MKILHVLQSNKISGAENVVADICMMFKNEYDMVYCSPDGPIRQALADRDVPCIPLRKLDCREVKRAIKEYKPDIIQAHDIRATVISALTAGKIPIISHLHGNHDDMRTFGLKPFLYMLATQKAKKVIVVSESCLNEYVFKKQIEKKTICLRNVLYFPRIEKLISKDPNEYDFDFLFIGRLSYPKNPQRVAKVASSVLLQCPTATFGVVGDGDLKTEMESIFKQNGVADRVTFTGRLDYPYKVLKQAKCMLMCSRFEGTPIAVLEAMALGVPVVSTPVDGMCALIDHNRNGYLSNNDEDLKESISGILQNKSAYNSLSIEGKSKFKILNDIDSYMSRLRDCYLNLLC